jgi:aminocarboxymuconate-semialdehyde decarboxylase
MVGFPFETTLAATRLVYSGLFENFKKLKIILNHVGGVVPFLWERLNRGYMNNWQGCRENISKLPTEYLKCFYYDTALSFPEALLFAFKLIGEHLLFGTDYPYTSKKMSNELEKNVKMIENLNLTREEKERIFSLNALGIISH